MAHMEVDRKVIHKWAAAAGATAGVLPIGADSMALANEEVMMVIHVASLFGQQIDKNIAAQALKTGVLGKVVGAAVFAGLNVGYPLTISAKVAVATGIMEALGNATYEFFNKGGTLTSGGSKSTNAKELSDTGTQS